MYSSKNFQKRPITKIQFECTIYISTYIYVISCKNSTFEPIIQTIISIRQKYVNSLLFLQQGAIKSEGKGIKEVLGRREGGGGA